MVRMNVSWARRVLPLKIPLCALSLCGLLLSVPLSAEEQDSPADPVDPVEIIERGASASESAPEPNRLSSLFYELQLMQNEVMKLRGELEEVGHRLDELGRQQSAQYMDMDRRIRGLSGLPSTSSTEDAAKPALASPSPDATATVRPVTPTQTGPQTEQDVYTQAFSLIEGRQFEQAVVAFDQFLIAYPNGEFTPNAFYWLGELHLRLEDLEKSRQSFVQVIRLFPENRKVPDALYKLGVVYDRLGDPETAEEHLQRTRDEHPGTTAAQLAEEYMKGRSS